MKRLLKHLSLQLIVCSVILLFGQMAYAANKSTPILPTDVKSASSGCTMLGLEGSYITEIDAAISRINEIRKEACKEGLKNPATGKPLTSSDYVPIKWSSDLEYIARIRAAEASLTMAHARTNGASGNDIFTLKSPNGIHSFEEVLAWNFSKTMQEGIEQWYEEKEYWIKNNVEEAGHYESLIDPTNLYVGLATFYSDTTYYPNSTAGEFCGNNYGTLDESHGKAYEDCIQILEVHTNACSFNYDFYNTTSVNAGKSKSIALTTSVEYTSAWNYIVQTNGLFVMNPVFSTSDESIATITSANEFISVLKANLCGQTQITAAIGSQSVTAPITVNHTYGKYVVIKEATALETGLKEKTCSCCGATKQATIKKLKATITLSAKSKSIKKGKTYTLKISGLATGDAVKSVKSSKTSVAKVKKVKKNQYKITGVKKGTATITVTLKSGKKATCKVTVK